MADTIGEMDKGWGEKIVFSVNEFKGKKYADIRIYFEDDEGEWKPTKKGITVALNNFAGSTGHIDQFRRIRKPIYHPVRLICQHRLLLLHHYYSIENGLDTLPSARKGGS